MVLTIYQEITFIQASIDLRFNLHHNTNIAVVEMTNKNKIANIDATIDSP